MGSGTARRSHVLVHRRLDLEVEGDHNIFGVVEGEHLKNRRQYNAFWGSGVPLTCVWIMPHVPSPWSSHQ